MKKLENILLFINCLIFMLLFIVLNLNSIPNHDIWWHLKTGEYILKNLEIPTKDIFSFVKHNQPWENFEWLSEVIFYLLYRGFGGSGLVIFKFLLYLCAYFLLFLIGKKIGTPSYLLFFLMTLNLLVVSDRLVIRPHIFTAFLSALFIYILWTKEQIHFKGILILSLLQIFWANLHAGCIFGIFIIISVLISKISTLMQSFQMKNLAKNLNSIRPYILLFILTVSATIVNPYFHKIFRYVFLPKTRPLFLANIIEWMPLFHPDFYVEFNFYLTLLWSILTVISIVLFIKDFKYSGWITLSVFTVFLTFHSQRFRENLVVVSFPLLSILSKNIYYSFSTKKLKSYLILSPQIIGYLIFGLLFFKTHFSVGHFGSEIGYGFPEKAVKFLKDNLPGSRIFNNYSFGGYLIWSLFPDKKPFIDGRNLSEEVYADYIYARENAEALMKIAEKYAIEIFLLAMPSSIQIGDKQIIEYLWIEPDWLLIYWDEISLIYIKKSLIERSPLIEQGYFYYNPAVFSIDEVIKGKEHKYLEEIERGIKNTPNWTRPLLDLVLLARGNNQTDLCWTYLNKVLEMEPKNAEAYNYLGLLKFDAGEYRKAIKYFEKAVQIEPTYYQAYGNMGLSFFELGELKMAKEKFQKVLKLNPTDRIALKMLKELSELNTR